MLIGDPKQAIYAFRGADIHTYLAARRDTAGPACHAGHQLSARAARWCDAVNHVFGQAEQRAEGRAPSCSATSGDNPLPFLPVQARGPRGALAGRGPRRAGAHLPGATTPARRSARRRTRSRWPPAARPRSCGCCNLGQQGQAGFARRTAARCAPLRPGDIAVLVNTGAEAAAVRAGAARARRAQRLSLRPGLRVPQPRRPPSCSACCRPAPSRTTTALLRAALGTRAAGPGLVRAGAPEPRRAALGSARASSSAATSSSGGARACCPCCAACCTTSTCRSACWRRRRAPAHRPAAPGRAAAAGQRAARGRACAGALAGRAARRRRGHGTRRGRCGWRATPTCSRW